jgi:hypothetical protein
MIGWGTRIRTAVTRLANLSSPAGALVADWAVRRAKHSALI